MELRSGALLGMCGLAGRLITGYLLDRFFGVRVSIVFFLATVVGVFLLSQGTAPAAFIGVAMIGFAAGGESDITPYLLSRYFTLQRFSTLYGFAWTAFAIGAAVGPVFMGRLFTSTGGYQPWGIQLLAIPTLASVVLMVMMPPYPALAGDRTDNRFPSPYSLDNNLTTGSLGIYNALLTAPRVQQFSLRYAF